MSESPALPAYDPKADDEAIEEVRKIVEAANPGREIWLFRHPKTGDWALYAPVGKPAWRTYKKKLTEQVERKELGNEELAYEFLCEQGVLYPSKDDFMALSTRRPAMPKLLAGEISEVCGYTGEAVQKKL